ncbi:hypothetical protein CRG98_000499 [Punica granatum]|uniref:Helicase C-terminal domain-containing protein n=1 Tax=Punica granatum TaxID=22663 RepID=A0A2I0LEU5_PUNGR|nr:hypothetical protein CRG98_000499 [Punica granatum]
MTLPPPEYATAVGGIKDFNDVNSNYEIFLLSTRAGGLGIDLTVADTCIFSYLVWSGRSNVGQWTVGRGKPRDPGRWAIEARAVGIVWTLDQATEPRDQLGRKSRHISLDGSRLKLGTPWAEVETANSGSSETWAVETRAEPAWTGLVEALKSEQLGRSGSRNYGLTELVGDSEQPNKKKLLNLHPGPSESRTNRRLGSGLECGIVGDSERKGSAEEEREKEGKKKESVGLKANGLGFGPTLACPSLEGRNEAWASPESGLNPESQNRPDSAISQFTARFTSDFGFSESPP